MVTKQIVDMYTKQEMSFECETRFKKKSINHATLFNLFCICNNFVL